MCRPRRSGLGLSSWTSELACWIRRGSSEASDAPSDDWAQPSAITLTARAEATSPRSRPPTPSATTNIHPLERDSWRDLGTNDAQASSLCGRTRPASLACPKTTSSMEVHHPGPVWQLPHMRGATYAPGCVCAWLRVQPNENRPPGVYPEGRRSSRSTWQRRDASPPARLCFRFGQQHALALGLGGLHEVEGPIQAPQD